MSSKVEMVIRILFALSLLVFGLNKFLYFIPTSLMEGTAGELMNIYVTSGFMKLIGGLEVLAGISLLAKKFVPLSLTIMAAIIFNAVIFHILHDLGGLGPAVVALFIVLLNIYFNKSRFTSLLSA
ncbi:MAG: DoxX family protein [Saprospiraceae bacterium]